MKSRSRATLFLIEQLIVIAVFALSAAACARILTAAYFDASTAKDLSYAILAAENGADSYKATNGDLGSVARLLGGATGTVDGSTAVIVHYDKDWQVTNESEATYRLTLQNGTQESELVIRGELTVVKFSGSTADTILEITVATLVNS